MCNEIQIDTSDVSAFKSSICMFSRVDLLNVQRHYKAKCCLDVSANFRSRLCKWNAVSTPLHNIYAFS